MANQNGIFITIKAWLPVTGPISEQIAKLQLVETAHATSDYAPLLAAATVEDVKAEQKTRRIEDQPQGEQRPAETEQAQVKGDGYLDGIVPQTEALKQQASKKSAA